MADYTMYVNDYHFFEGNFNTKFSFNEIDRCFNEVKDIARQTGVEDEVEQIYKAFVMNLAILYSNKRSV